ncbi:UbiA prenyltransferase family-domain-containing protein [Xylaria sp. CBS 124048]|nr:UbiA prenyltransferase family-domain-containing protein [Xylaria sp. CBS 124048]
MGSAHISDPERDGRISPVETWPLLDPSALETSEFGAKSFMGKVGYIPHLVWEFTESDFHTFVIPNTAFGILGAFAALVLTDGLQRPPTALEILCRLPLVLAFNWYNVFIFDVANQRSAESIQEDLINKVWRPIPMGKVTAMQARRILLVAIPLAILLNYQLGVRRQGFIILVLTWMYNDLRGGDEVVRDLVISVAYGMFNSASLEIAVGGGEYTDITISRDGMIWTFMISAIILTTMQVQDLKDQAGDRTRGRQTIVLWMGERFSRNSIAFFVCLWSAACLFFWRPRLCGCLLPASSGAMTAYRVLAKKTPKEDATTWRYWSLWTVTLYLLPITGLL